MVTQCSNTFSYNLLIYILLELLYLLAWSSKCENQAERSWEHCFRYVATVSLKALVIGSPTIGLGLRLLYHKYTWHELSAAFTPWSNYISSILESFSESVIFLLLWYPNWRWGFKALFCLSSLLFKQSILSTECLQLM